jgi:hypothetical protein
VPQMRPAPVEYTSRPFSVIGRSATHQLVV